MKHQSLTWFITIIICKKILRLNHIPLIPRIIEDVYSPDYYEPTLILDYRYLKSGGRDYTRGPGGQILILPRGVHTHEHKEHKDYDSLIEFLRLRHLAQTEAKKQRHEDEELVHSRHHDFEDERSRGHGVEERWG